LFTFNASSFPLDSSVESYLKSKGALSLDFGTFAYVNSEMMPTILSELIERGKAEASSDTDLVAKLKAEVGRYSAERQKIIEDNTRLASQIKSYAAEVAALKEQTAGTTRLVETLKSENARLHSAMQNTPAVPSTQLSLADDKLKQSYEKLVKDYQALRAQCAEALTSLKVLEDENDELMLELEKMRNQINAASAKTT
jgi:chromosome segregation ATPase